MNRLQRQLREISDARMDDTAVEMAVCEQARAVVEITRRALRDGRIADRAARQIIAAQVAVIDASDRSLAYNVREQRTLDAFIDHLGHVPTDAVARLPRLRLGGREAA